MCSHVCIVIQGPIAVAMERPVVAIGHTLASMNSPNTLACERVGQEGARERKRGSTLFEAFELV